MDINTATIDELVAFMDNIRNAIIARRDAMPQSEPAPEPFVPPTIEAHIPVPQHVLRGSKYPIEKLAVGESFYIPGEAASGHINSTIGNRLIRDDKKFTVKSIYDGSRHKIGARCWRLK